MIQPDFKALLNKYNSQRGVGNFSWIRFAQFIYENCPDFTIQLLEEHIRKEFKDGRNS